MIVEEFGPQFTVLEGNGLGAFAIGTRVYPKSIPSAVVTGDLNGDSRVDLLFLAPGTKAPLEVFLNSPSGQAVFSATLASMSPLSSSWPCAALFDVDGDSDLDLFVGDSGQDRILLNDGSGKFGDATAQWLPVLSGDSAAVHVFDYDRDGDFDVLLGQVGAPDVLLINQGNRYVDSPSLLPSTALDTYGLASADVDGDGDLDVVLATGHGAKLLLWAGGKFGLASQALPVRDALSEAVLLADVDGDGDPDLVVGRGNSARGRHAEYGQSPEILYNDGAGRFSGPEVEHVPHMPKTVELAIGDFTGDGYPDVIDSGARRLTNDGGGGFSVSAIPNATAIPWPFAGDLDGDASVDVVQLTRSDAEIWLGGGPAFPSRTVHSLGLSPSESAVSAALADFDGDGDVDATNTTANNRR